MDNMFVFEEEKEISSKSTSKGKHAAGKKQKVVKNKKNKQSKMKKWQKALLITVISLLVVLAILVGVFFKFFSYNYNDLSDGEVDLGFTEIINKRIVNIALFGIDSRDTKSFEGLSDSIMILSANTETKKIKITSVMRDSLVPIEYDGKTTYNKINYAYSKGGPELAVKTLNKCFGLDISEYATVNFYGMADIIDAVGGIEATVTKGELTCKNHLNSLVEEQCEYMGISPSKHYVKNPGKQLLNGIQAVAYARIRYAATENGTANDQGRTERQRYVMEQLFNKATTLSKTQYISLAKALIPCSETSLSYGDIISLATSILLDSPTFEQTRIPLDEYQMPTKKIPKVGSNVYYDIDYASKVLHAFIYDDVDPYTYMEENGIEKNDWYAKR